MLGFKFYFPFKINFYLNLFSIKIKNNLFSGVFGVIEIIFTLVQITKSIY